MGNRKLYLTVKHRILEAASFLLLLIALVVVIVRGVTSDGELIPTHFNARGEADAYGSVWSLLIMPVIMLLCNGMTSLLLHFMPPSAWNMPARVKAGNELISYRWAAWALVLTEFWLSLFALLYTIVDEGFGWLGLGLALALTVSLGVPIVRIIRINRA